MRTGIGIALCAAGLALAGCAEESGGGDESDGTAATTATTAQVDRPELSLDVVGGDATVRRASVVLRGTVTRGARVTVDRRPATVADGRWRRRVALGHGENLLVVRATKREHEPATADVTLTREPSAAELAARRQRARARRERAEAEFKAQATTPAYNQLEKEADDDLAGAKVRFTGQIFQIQEDPAGGGILLLSVTDEGYGLWTDNVWVNYSGELSSAEEDVITVYGVVDGTRSYETQIGGETYVPEITARYVEE